MPTRKKAATPRKRPVSKTAKPKRAARRSYAPYTPLDFADVERQANELADHIESHFEEIAHILLEYESYEVVLDETERTLDLLRNLKENKSYFKLRVGAITSFLPRNQPLYAFACFVIVPSLMASEVHFRIPYSMRHFFPKLLVRLGVSARYPNISVSHSTRNDFIQERSALRVNPRTKESLPVTDAVIFTGTPVAAEQLRLLFDQRTLFITNGSGHNPVVVTEENADLKDAVDAALSLQLYNQGQDCAAPNAILVHKDKYQDFLRMLRDEIRTVRVGDYRDRQCRVGPISEPKDLVRIKGFLIDHREWLDPTTPGVMRAYDAILEPTIITKPLKLGGNFIEIFAPVIFLQQYDEDAELSLYFQDPRYAQNAMYITLYGKSDYVKKLIDRPVEGRVLHNKESLLHNLHLHAPGSERGTQPYGGNGYGASNVSINGKVIAKPTLPQRDIFEWVAKPLLPEKARRARLALLKSATTIHHKDVARLMRLKARESDKSKIDSEGITYVDLKALPTQGRYVVLEPGHTYRLLEEPNVHYMSKLHTDDLRAVRALRTLLMKKTFPKGDISTKLYAIVVDPKLSSTKNRSRQLEFFRHIYNLLLGKDSGPRLAQFLLEIDRKQACTLLDV